MSAVMIVGLPQPIFTIGPTTYLSSAGGNTERKSLMIFEAFAMTVLGSGNRIESSVRFLRPVRRTSISMERLTPMSPPTPESVNPMDNCIGGLKVAQMLISNANPSEPSGIFVVIKPIAVSPISPKFKPKGPA